jgi:hypothetical protein
MSLIHFVKSKWGRAKSTIGKDGLKYDSLFEAAYANELFLRQRAGEIQGYDSHPRLDLRVNDKHVCYYKVDFAVYHNDGSIEYVECKGWESREWKLKWKLFEALYGDAYQLTVVKQKKARKFSR